VKLIAIDKKELQPKNKGKKNTYYKLLAQQRGTKTITRRLIILKLLHLFAGQNSLTELNFQSQSTN